MKTVHFNQLDVISCLIIMISTLLIFFCWEETFLSFQEFPYDLFMGLLVSGIFYFLLVYLPEGRKNFLVKRHLNSEYDFFKMRCIERYLLSLDGNYLVSEPERLLDRDQFKEYFKGEYKPGQTRWQALVNKMEEYDFDKIKVLLDLFMAEINFSLLAANSKNIEAILKIRRLHGTLLSLKHLGTDYDELK